MLNKSQQFKRKNKKINDYDEYVAGKATVAELKAQNSYFINSLYKCDEETTPCATLYDKGVKRDI
ncbi:MAG: hypothetical protein SO003_00120 [Candidatus Borkfalkiaceae bacterium]|nr:hypothetical protein [Christensenellaceae bacterium]